MYYFLLVFPLYVTEIINLNLNEDSSSAQLAIIIVTVSDFYQSRFYLIFLKSFEMFLV
jgi:hypothetical protein